MYVNNTIITSLDYRGHHIDFYDDPDGNQVYAIWKSKAIYFGTFNTDYVAEMKKIIDLDEDTIYVFKEYPGARLMYFKNACWLDIKLVYNKRTLRIYPALGSGVLSDENKEGIIKDAQELLERFYINGIVDKNKQTD